MSRYAVYGVPGVEPGAPEPARRLRAAVEDWYAKHPEITVHPRRYGFHATLKAPFALAAGTTAGELEQAVSEFASGRDAVVLRAVRPVAIGSFRALVPTGDVAAVNALAADAVRAFEAFRAPLTDADIARRRPETLTPRQRELLSEVGYPFSLDEFRPHLTLTDSLGDPDSDDDGSDAVWRDDSADVDAAIAAHFAEFDGVDIPLTAVAVFVEPARAEPFRIHSIHPLRETA